MVGAQDGLDPTPSDPRRAVSTSGTWLVHRLTGGYVMGAATAGRTQLLDRDRAD